jgi:hypothetical protein
MNLLKLKGLFKLLHYRKGILLAEYIFENTIVDQGANHILNVGFGGAAQVDPWYIGLINNSPTPTILTSDTLAAHSGWQEFTGYTGNRQVWDDTAAGSRSKGTTSSAAFPITGAATIHGLFICSVATGTSGTLWSAGPVDDVVAVVNGDTLNAGYILQA